MRQYKPGGWEGRSPGDQHSHTPHLPARKLRVRKCIGENVTRKVVRSVGHEAHLPHLMQGWILPAVSLEPKAAAQAVPPCDCKLQTRPGKRQQQPRRLACTRVPGDRKGPTRLAFKAAKSQRREKGSGSFQASCQLREPRAPRPCASLRQHVMPASGA